MAEVTGLTKDRMLAIEAASVVGGTVDGAGHLILSKHDATTIDAGLVKGNTGAPGTISYQATEPTSPIVGQVWVDSDEVVAIPSPVPIGGIMAFGGSVAPIGWQICDGSVASTAELVAVVGANVPDLRGKFVLGVSASHAQGTTGGAETVALVPAEMPSHNHSGSSGAMSANATHDHGGATPSGGAVDHLHQSGSDPGAFHLHRSRTVNMYAAASGGGPWTLHTLSAGGTQNDVVDSAGNHTHTSGAADRSLSHAHTVNGSNVDHNHSITANGSNTAHENMPPFYSLVYIIRSAP